MHDLLSVHDHCEPVKALLEDFLDQCSGRHVMSADPSVDFSQKLLSLVSRDASLEDPRCAALVKDVSYDHEGFAAPC